MTPQDHSNKQKQTHHELDEPNCRLTMKMLQGGHLQQRRKLRHPRKLSSSIIQLILLGSIVSFVGLLSLAGEGSQFAAGQVTMELHRRVKRALYDLPAGAELILGPNIRTTFTCDNLGYGYYADQDNDCKIFHVCQSFKMSDGSIYNNHWSFLCGNQTVFNQVTLACSHPEDAIPCESSRDFYHVNDYFGDTRAPSVRDSDLIAAQELVSRSYGARLTSSASSPATVSRIQD